MRKTVEMWFLPIVIVLLAIGLRFYGLGQIPIELNRDEASLGYNAYSILKTGHEEHGIYWPLNIKSFGDWKLPVYVYTLIPFIRALGLTPWTVRLPSALAGIGIVVLSGYLTWLLSASWVETKWRRWLVNLVLLLMAISPWHIHLSHLAYEANLGLFLFLGAVVSFILAIRRRRGWLVLSAALFGLTLFTYHSYQVLTPLMAIGLAIIYRPQIQKFWSQARVSFFLSLGLAGLFSWVLISTSIAANQTKFAALSIFDKRAYLPVTEVSRSYFTDRTSILAKIYDNSLTLFINQVQRNVADLFSARFFFLEGGSHGAHDIPGTGKFYPIALVFFTIAGYGLLGLWQRRQLRPDHHLILWWLVASAVAPLITFEAAHTIRFSPALFPLTFLAGWGLLKLVQLSRNSWVGKGLLAASCLILAYSALHFFLTYFIVSPKRDINHHNWQMRRVIEIVNEKQDHYDRILIPGPTWSPYIYFLFYNQVNPATLDEVVEYYPTGDDGFQHVKKLGKIDFSPSDWINPDHTRSLYVVKRPQVSIDKLENGEYGIEYSLTNPWAKDEWLFLSHQ